MLKIFPRASDGAPKNYFKKEIFMLKATGVSFAGNESPSYKIFAYVFNFLVFTYPLVQFGDLFKHDFDGVASIISYQFGVLISISKTTVLLLNRIKFGQTLSKLEKPPFVPDPKRGGEEEARLIRDCLWVTTAQTLIYWGCAVVSMIFDGIYIGMKRVRSSDYHDWKFPYGQLTVLNVTHSPNYEISWFYQTFCIFGVAAHMTTIDLITAAVLAHISCQFQILQHNLKRMVEKSYKDMVMVKNVWYGMKIPSKAPPGEIDGSAIPWRYLKKSLVDMVQYHLAIIGIAQEMENLYNRLLLLVFLGTVGMLCFMVYCASLLPINDIRMVQIGVQTLTMTVQILVVCYWGELVMHESQEVPKAVYQANFVGTDVRFQKGLSMIMRRGQKPVKLTAGKFTDICLATFTWILRTSYSVFMVLTNSNKRRI